MERQRETSHLLTVSANDSNDRSKQSQSESRSQKSGARSQESLRTQGLKAFAHFPLFFQVISWELGWKWSSCDTNWCSHGMSALKAKD